MNIPENALTELIKQVPFAVAFIIIFIMHLRFANKVLDIQVKVAKTIQEQSSVIANLTSLCHFKISKENGNVKDKQEIPRDSADSADNRG